MGNKASITIESCNRCPHRDKTRAGHGRKWKHFCTEAQPENMEAQLDEYGIGSRGRILPMKDDATMGYGSTRHENVCTGEIPDWCPYLAAQDDTVIQGVDDEDDLFLNWLTSTAKSDGMLGWLDKYVSKDDEKSA